MKRLILLLPLAFGCATTIGLTRIPSAQPSVVPPKIDKLTDLGALPVAADGAINAAQSDERFTPSEWVAVVGQGLHGAQLTLDGAPLEVGGFLDGGSVLVRLPSDLAPAPHKLVAKAAGGESETSFDSLVYVIGSDTDGNAIRFLRIGAKGQDRVDDPSLSVKQVHTLFHALSPDGAMLYGLGLTDKKAAGDVINYTAEVSMVHMGAAQKPEWLGSISFAMTSHPSGIAVTPDGVLLILGTSELLLFTLTDPKSPQPIGKLQLTTDPMDRFLEMALFQKGKALALLEVNDNRVVAISLAEPTKPRSVAELVLGPAENFPFSVDLVADPTDPNAFFVLQGLNLRLGGKKIEEGKNAISGLVQVAYDLVSGKSPPAKEAPKVAVPKKGRLVGLKLRDTVLEKVTEIQLPDEFLPLFAVAAKDGSFFVSGVAPGALETSSLDASVDGAAKLVDFIKGSVQLGKIARIDRKGASTIAVQGVAVFFDLDLLPNDELVYSGMRISGKALPPFLAVKWGVGIGATGFFGLHDLAYDYVVPPYSYGQVSVQHGLR